MTWLDFLKTASEIGCRPKSVGFSWTVCVPTCPVKFHCVDFTWVDTSFPLGLDFEMKQGGSIVVKNVYGEARAQNADILKGEVILALNGTCVKGWSMEKFVEAVRAAAPGSNAHCQNGCDPTRTKLSAKPSKQASVNISFTFARKDTSNPMRSKVRKGL